MIAVISTFFNPAKYKLNVKNLKRFRECLGVDGADFFLCEVSFDGEYETDACHKIIANKNQVLWQKERIVNLMIERLPEKYDKFVWLDTDLIFTDPDWLRKMDEALDEFNVVQGFSHIYYTDDAGKVDRTSVSYMEAVRSGAGFGAPGGCWGARLDALPDRKIIDNHVVGGGDHLLVNAWLGKPDAMFPTNIRQRIVYLQDYLKQNEAIDGRVGCLAGGIIHLYHGDRVNRQYTQRHEILFDEKFDPNKDIEIAKNGLWEWATEKPEFHRKVKDYFYDRKEDDATVSELVPFSNGPDPIELPTVQTVQDSNITFTATPAALPPCKYRGESYRLAVCKPCKEDGNPLKIKVFGCYQFGECSSNGIEGTKKCTTCEKIEP